MKNLNRKHQSLLLIILFSLSVSSFAQKVLKAGDNPTTVNGNAVLELESTNKGLLLPRIALTNTTAFAPLTAHIAGMKVYNTATAGDVTPGEYYNDGAKWVRVADGATSNNYTFLRTSDNLPATTVGNQNIKAYRNGHTQIGNKQTDPDALFIAPSITVGNTLSVAEEVTSTAGKDFWFNIGSGYKITATEPNKNLFGIGNNMEVHGSQNVAWTFSIAGNNQIYNTGTIARGDGGYLGVALQSAGTITNAIGFRSYASNNSTGTITTAKGLDTSVDNTGGGTIGTGYGLYISDIQATNDWGIYQLGTDDNNYFGANTKIGTSDTTLKDYKLAVESTVTATTGAISITNAGTFFKTTMSPTAPSTSYYSGNITLVETSSPNLAAANIAGIVPRVISSGTSNYGGLVGINPFVSHNSSGTAGFIIASDNAPTNSGTATTMIGTKSWIINSGTITDAYNFKSENSAAGGTITNGYGLYLDDVKGTNQWGVYQADATDRNNLAGHTHLGNQGTNPDNSFIYGSGHTNVLNIEETIPAANYVANTQIMQLSTEFNPPTGFAGGSLRMMNVHAHTKVGATNLSTSSVNGIIIDGVHKANTNLGTMIGANATSFTYGTGSITNATGFSGAVGNYLAGATITNAVGAVGIISNAAGATITKAIGLQATIANSGTITNGFGLLIENVNATNQWGIYQDGLDDRNYFNGNTGLKTNDPKAVLDIATLDDRGALIRSGNSSNIFTNTQLSFGWNGTSDYRQAIKTRHNSGGNFGNSFDFYLWNPSVAINANPAIAAVSVSLFGSGNTNVGAVGINQINPRAELDVVGTGAIIVPVGTTAQRPATPVQGMIRYDTTLGKFQGYNGTTWNNLD